MNDWTDKDRKHINGVGRPRMNEDKKRQRIHMSVHPNVKNFLDAIHEETGVRPGQLIDKLMSDAFAVKIEE